MRSVTASMVLLENARFHAGAAGWFSAKAVCPVCHEERQITVPISEPGQVWKGDENCNKGHHWAVRAHIKN